MQFFPSEMHCKRKTKLSAQHQADSAPQGSLQDLHPACWAQTAAEATSVARVFPTDLPSLSSRTY